MIRKTLLVISVVLLLGTVGLWVVSYEVAIGARVYTGLSHVQMQWSYGTVEFSHQRHIGVRGHPLRFQTFMDGGHPRTHRRADYGLLGFQRSVTRVVPLVRRTVACPAWTLSLLLACPPVLLARSMHRERHRLRHNLCVKCGYDLRGNVSGVCSECGAAVPATGSIDASTP